MIPVDECMYYLVRAYGGMGVREKKEHFDGALAHIRERGFKNVEMSALELRALIAAAKRRGWLEELDEVVNYGKNKDRMGNGRLEPRNWVQPSLFGM